MKTPAVLLLVFVLVLVVAAMAGTTAYARRRGDGAVGRTVVRCRDGHLYTTTWIPGVSFKSVRLGRHRWQYCPIGRHWTMVTPVRDDELTPQERDLAATHHDRHLP
ncbi:hypothetical protein ABZT17_27670 [Streptomyces sp. NPDC005648]|uniref:hypothetical protein n=1 Tax=Streptomyces sp. NPDC005648 TaxID=3157044 RepID=UPI0033ABF98C